LAWLAGGECVCCGRRGLKAWIRLIMRVGVLGWRLRGRARSWRLGGGLGRRRWSLGNRLMRGVRHAPDERLQTAGATAIRLSLGLARGGAGGKIGSAACL
jgi:hypothetical protein